MVRDLFEGEPARRVIAEARRDGRSPVAALADAGLLCPSAARGEPCDPQAPACGTCS